MRDMKPITELLLAAKRVVKKWRASRIFGALFPPEDYSDRELRAGVLAELEKGLSEKDALEAAIRNLSADPKYYVRATIENVKFWISPAGEFIPFHQGWTHESADYADLAHIDILDRRGVWPKTDKARKDFDKLCDEKDCAFGDLLEKGWVRGFVSDDTVYLNVYSENQVGKALSIMPAKYLLAKTLEWEIMDIDMNPRADGGVSRLEGEDLKKAWDHRHDPRHRSGGVRVMDEEWAKGARKSGRLRGSSESPPESFAQRILAGLSVEAYHGTVLFDKVYPTIESQSGMQWVTPSEVSAQWYAEVWRDDWRSSGKGTPAYYTGRLNLRNPLVIDTENDAVRLADKTKMGWKSFYHEKVLGEAPSEERLPYVGMIDTQEETTSWAMDNGYDGVVYSPGFASTETTKVGKDIAYFDPSRFKIMGVCLWDYERGEFSVDTLLSIPEAQKKLDEINSSRKKLKASMIDPSKVIERADLGDYAMGGGCFSSAVALKNTLFPQGTIKVSVNDYLYRVNGDFVGHCFVENSGRFYDAEGEKAFEDMESWGMLDPEDSDYIERAGVSPEKWEEVCGEVKTFVPSPEELKSLVKTSEIKEVERRIKKAMSLKASMIDYPRPELAADLWDRDGKGVYHIKPEVREALEKETYQALAKHAKAPEKWTVSLLLGSSIASQFYTEATDIDIKAVIDPEAFRKANPEHEALGDTEVVAHLDSLIEEDDRGVNYGTHPIEIRVRSEAQLEDPQFLKNYDSLYDMTNDVWIKEFEAVDVKTYSRKEAVGPGFKEALKIAEKWDLKFGVLRRALRELKLVGEYLAHIGYAMGKKDSEEEAYAEKLAGKCAGIIERLYAEKKAVKAERGEAYKKARGDVKFVNAEPGVIKMKALVSWGYFTQVNQLHQYLEEHGGVVTPKDCDALVELLDGPEKIEAGARPKVVKGWYTPSTGEFYFWDAYSAKEENAHWRNVPGKFSYSPDELRQSDNSVYEDAVKRGLIPVEYSRAELNIRSKDPVVVSEVLSKMPHEYLITKFVITDGVDVPVLEGEDAAVAWKRRNDARHHIRAKRSDGIDDLIDHSDYKFWITPEGSLEEVYSGSDHIEYLEDAFAEEIAELEEELGDFGKALYKVEDMAYKRGYYRGWVQSGRALGISAPEGKMAELIAVVEAHEPEWGMVEKVFSNKEEVPVLEGETAEKAWRRRKDIRHRVSAASKGSGLKFWVTPEGDYHGFFDNALHYNYLRQHLGRSVDESADVLDLGWTRGGLNGTYLYLETKKDPAWVLSKLPESVKAGVELLTVDNGSHSEAGFTSVVVDAGEGVDKAWAQRNSIRKTVRAGGNGPDLKKSAIDVAYGLAMEEEADHADKNNLGKAFGKVKAEVDSHLRSDPTTLYRAYGFSTQAGLDRFLSKVSRGSLTSLGISWSWRPNTQAYLGRGRFTVTLEAKVPHSSIDWVQTYGRGLWYTDEGEVTLIPGSPITVTGWGNRDYDKVLPGGISVKADFENDAWWVTPDFKVVLVKRNFNSSHAMAYCEATGESYADLWETNKSEQGILDKAISEGWVKGTYESGFVLLEGNFSETDEQKITKIMSATPAFAKFPEEVEVFAEDGSIRFPVLEGEDALDAWKHRNDIRHRVRASGGRTYYHGTTDRAWNRISKGSSDLFISISKKDAKNYAYEAAERGGNPILVSIPSAALAGFTLGPDTGWLDSEGKSFQESLAEVHGGVAHGDVEALKPKCRIEVLASSVNGVKTGINQTTRVDAAWQDHRDEIGLTQNQYLQFDVFLAGNFLDEDGYADARAAVKKYHPNQKIRQTTEEEAKQWGVKYLRGLLRTALNYQDKVVLKRIAKMNKSRERWEREAVKHAEKVGKEGAEVGEGCGTNRKITPSKLWESYRGFSVKASIIWEDRYTALGLPYPDPDTVCKGQCEGLGVVPIFFSDNLPYDPMRAGCRYSEDEINLWKHVWDEAEAEEHSDSGWHFLPCPDCNSTGKRPSVGQPEMSPEKEAVYEAVGEASMAWDETPQGVFDTAMAGEIAEKLCEELGIAGGLKDVHAASRVAYHATNTRFTKFKYGEFGFHFGDKETALDFIRQGAGRILMKVRLDLQNPFKFKEDLQTWNDVTVGDYLVEHGVMSRMKADAISDMQRWMMAHGWDGYTYPNAYEGKGSLSYAVFTPEQIEILDTQEIAPKHPGVHAASDEALYRAANAAIQDDPKFSNYHNDPTQAKELGELQQKIKDCRSKDEIQRVWETYAPSLSFEQLEHLADQKAEEK